MKKSLLTTGILAAGLAISGAAHALTTAGTLNVSATVVAECAITTTPVNFGNLITNTFSPVSSGDVSVTCSPGVLYTITLDAGQHQNVGLRHMRSQNNGVSLALYILTSDVAGTISWGDSGYANTFPAHFGVADTGSGGTQPHTIYGYAAGRDSFGNPSPAGSYADTVNVTVNY